MAAVLDGSPRTTPRVRAELQTSQASTQALAAPYGLNPETVAKWRARASTADGTDPATCAHSEGLRAVLPVYPDARVAVVRPRAQNGGALGTRRG